MKIESNLIDMKKIYKIFKNAHTYKLIASPSLNNKKKQVNHTYRK